MKKKVLMNAILIGLLTLTSCTKPKVNEFNSFDEIKKTSFVQSEYSLLVEKEKMFDFDVRIEHITGGYLSVDDYELNWTSSDNTIVKVNDEGLATPLSVGQAILSVEVVAPDTYKNKGSSRLSASTSVRVSEEGVLLETITINEGNLSLKVNDERNLTYSLYPVDAYFNNLVFSSSNPDVVQANGAKIKAIKEGTAQVSVSATTLNEEIRNHTVTVTVAKENTTIPLESVVIDLENTITIKENEGRNLPYHLVPANANYSNINWSSANPSIATVTSAGYLKGVKKGNTTITLNVDSKTDSINVTVTEENVNIPVQDVNIDLSGTIQIKENEGKTIPYSLVPSNATYTNLSWTSGNPSIATITNAGYLKGVKKGNTIITITVDGKSDEINVSVLENDTSGLPSYLRPTSGYTGSYYNSINESATGTSFKQSVRSLINTNYNEGSHTYSGLSGVFPLSDKDPDTGKMLWFYSGTPQNGFSGNREHVWPKDGGKAFPEKTGPGKDAHHLRPTDNTLNSSRGSKQMKELTPGASGVSIAKQGSSTTYGRFSGPEWVCYMQGDWFYPAKGWRGQTARILMYVELKWGHTWNLNLVLGGGDSKTIGDFETLMRWHLEEPVSEYEMARNNYVNTIQNNRNPFIDHPEWAGKIYSTDGGSYNNVIKEVCGL